MKQAFLCALTMASCLLAPPAHAQLQWFGPLPTATKPAATPRPPPAPPRPARRQIDDGDNDILHSKHVGLPLKLVIKDNRAKVCQLSSTLATVCAAIEAPLPPGTTVQLSNLPDGTIALSYMRTPGVQGAPDPDGKAAVHFQAAFNGAARAVLAHNRSNGRKPNIEKACTDEDCDDILGGDGAGGGGGGGGGGGNDGGSGGGGGNISGGENGDVAVVEVHGKPDPDTALPQVIVNGHHEPGDTDFDPSAIPQLPPRDREDDLAGLTDPCIISPIATVCVVGKRPPLSVDEPPLPTGNPPIFPQWACNFAHVLCTRGQIPRDDNPGPADPPYDPSWPKKPQFNQCINGAAFKLDYCKGMIKILPVDQVQQCVDEVNIMIDDCHLLYGPGK